jgi:hypothetical protein
MDLVAVEFHTPQGELVELYDFRPDSEEKGILARVQVHQLPEDYVSEYVRLPLSLNANASVNMEVLELRRGTLSVIGSLSLEVEPVESFLVRRYKPQNLARIAAILDKED